MRPVLEVNIFPQSRHIYLPSFLCLTVPATGCCWSPLTQLPPATLCSCMSWQLMTLSCPAASYLHTCCRESICWSSRLPSGCSFDWYGCEMRVPRLTVQDLPCLHTPGSSENGGHVSMISLAKKKQLQPDLGLGSGRNDCLALITAYGIAHSLGSDLK